jgi:hypothetical protein
LVILLYLLLHIRKIICCSYKYDITKASDEHLRAGDVIFYYDSLFGCRKSGEKTAQVVEVIPENVNGPMIRLDNWGHIDPTDVIKRVKVYIRGKLHDNPEPKWRELQDFVLIAQKLDPNAKKPRESRLGQEVGQLLKCLSSQYPKMAAEQGMPKDLLCFPCSDGSRLVNIFVCMNNYGIIGNNVNFLKIHFPICIMVTCNRNEESSMNVDEGSFGSSEAESFTSINSIYHNPTHKKNLLQSQHRMIIMT